MTNKILIFILFFIFLGCDSTPTRTESSKNSDGVGIPAIYGQPSDAVSITGIYGQYEDGVGLIFIDHEKVKPVIVDRVHLAGDWDGCRYESDGCGVTVCQTDNHYVTNECIDE